ncbi:hypothetical protein ACHAQA_004682 [Verticillium albo-atrum]
MDTGSNPQNPNSGGNTTKTPPTYLELSNLEAQPPAANAAATAGPSARPNADEDAIQPPDAAHLPGYSEATQTAKPPRYEKYKNEPPPGFSGIERRRWQYAHWIVVMTVFMGIGLGVGIYYGVVQARGGGSQDDRP